MVQSTTGYVAVDTAAQGPNNDDTIRNTFKQWALSPNKEQTLKELDQLATLFDDRFRVPGTSFRFGLDSMIGLVPGIGDTVTAGVATYLVAKARQLGVRKRIIVKMLGNVAVDWVLGIIPLVGDIFDFAHKANRKNVALLRRELLIQAPST